MASSFKMPLLSLRIRIFISMVLLIIVASLLLASISILQFKNEAREYNQKRLESIEYYVKKHINHVLSETTYPLTTTNLSLIFKDKIHEIADIQGVEINIYSLEGQLLKSSKESFSVDPIAIPVPKYILRLVQSSIEKRFVAIKTIDGIKTRSAYSQIKDDKFKPLGILNLPSVTDDDYYENEMHNFLIRLGQVYAFIMIVAFGIAYFLSSYITKPINEFAAKLSETSLNHKNEKIPFENKIKEIDYLLKAYNRMIEELEKNAIKLAQNERDLAWREMAKQVAHEIKNPLTPMRLTVQSFQRKFDPSDPNVRQKMNDYSETLIQQIDTMTSVASAFSNFATMPAQQNETLDVVNVVELAVDIFNEEYVVFESPKEAIISKMDRTQLIRIITNLTKNAIQAIPENQEIKSVLVSVKRVKDVVEIAVKDNGKGIEQYNFERIFEPKFTTKNSGMGLGLGIIKNIIENYKGTITFESEFGKGTTFTVILPIINS